MAKAKQKGRVIKKMICDCSKAEHDTGSEKKLFGCECSYKTKVKGKWVWSKKNISDVGILDINWVNSQNQYGEFTTRY